MQPDVVPIFAARSAAPTSTSRHLFIRPVVTVSGVSADSGGRPASSHQDVAESRYERRWPITRAPRHDRLGRAGAQPLALYVTNDGQNAIAGTLIDKNGNDLTHDALEASSEPSVSKELWGQLEHATWVVDGKPAAPKVVYVFTDPNCPYCSRFWAEARPWVDAGRVQIRHVLVGILTPSSPGKAAALLTSRDPSSALHDYEARQTKAVDAQMAAGHARALEDRTLAPLDPIPVDIAKKLAANAQLMQAFSMQATPGFVWHDNAGTIRARTGLPPDQLESVLGPKPR
ncbi:disulfide isomerase/thiol-disulfide oxidase [Burkholderia sp. SJ98]|nr:disulfide isomerase/thiol-disulfide oxidase [Burkholderia sp. SJ98]